MIPCKYCDRPFSPVDETNVFHSGRCKAAWHRENVPHGTITSVRQLKRGGYAVTVRYQTLPAGLFIGGSAWHETIHGTGTDATSGNQQKQ